MDSFRTSLPPELNANGRQVSKTKTADLTIQADEILTVEEVATYLKLKSKRAVYDLISESPEDRSTILRISRVDREALFWSVTHTAYLTDEATSCICCVLILPGEDLFYFVAYTLDDHVVIAACGKVVTAVNPALHETVTVYDLFRCLLKGGPGHLQ
jgi:hypothetical protein